jgi:DNA polymerase III delta subunit
LKRSESVLDFFIQKTGSSLFHIQNELDKLVLFAEKENISEVLEKHINLITFGMTEANSFTFFDILLSDKKKAMDLIVSIKEEGQNRNAFAGTLYWGLKIWIFILDCFEQNIKDSKIITSILKVHPFVVSKSLKNIDLISRNKNGIISFYN